MSIESIPSVRKTPLDGVNIESWFIHLDKEGSFINDANFSEMINSINDKNITDIVFFSHGWNNGYETAKERYADYMRKWQKNQIGDHNIQNVFFIGIIWPSKWFEDFPLNEITLPEHSIISEEVLSDFISALDEDSLGTSKIERIRHLIHQESLSEDEMLEFFNISLDIFLSRGNDDILYEDDLITPQDLVVIMKNFYSEIYGLKTPRRFFILDIIRIFSVRQMKDRSEVIGKNGVAYVLDALLNSNGKTKIHLVGHSFGCKVVMSALVKNKSPVRPVSSLLLLQPAVSYLCFTEEDVTTGVKGGYHIALDPSRLAIPVFTTFSRLDKPLYYLYHLAFNRKSDPGNIYDPPNKFAALGGYGPRLTNEKIEAELPKSGSSYVLDKRFKVYGFDGSNKQINCHGDIATDETAWLLSLLMSYSKDV